MMSVAVALALMLTWYSHTLLLTSAEPHSSAASRRSRLDGLSIIVQAASPPSEMVSHPRQSAPQQWQDDDDSRATLRTNSSNQAADTECELLFTMPTVSRGSSGVSYLNVTLEALLCQISEVSAPPRVCIFVYEPRAPSAGLADGPTAFEAAERSLASHPYNLRTRVLFVRGSNHAGVTGGSAGGGGRGPSVNGPAPNPASKLARTRQQTKDVAHMLLALQSVTSARHIVLMEDDWILCEGGLRAIGYLLAKASLYQPEFAALRFSYGLNGLLLPATDLTPLARFLLDPAAEPENVLPDAPVDHLTYRWLRGKYGGGRRYFGRRRIMAFRHTLFWHVGDASAVGNAKSRHKPKCYGLTREWLFEQESFHVDDCPEDDLWPCSSPTFAPAANSQRGLAVRQLMEHAEASASGGAARCGAARLCWQQPATSGKAAQCARSLRCGANGQKPATAKNCLQTLPEYAGTR